MLESTYWNGRGKYQNELREMIDAQWNNKYTKKSKETAYRYYRFYNDGDVPKGMSTFSKAMISARLEKQADEMISGEYKRFCKNKET